MEHRLLVQLVVRRLHEQQKKNQSGASVGFRQSAGSELLPAPARRTTQASSGLYDLLGTNSVSVENASYVKLREVSIRAIVSARSQDQG